MVTGEGEGFHCLARGPPTVREVGLPGLVGRLASWRRREDRGLLRSCDDQPVAGKNLPDRWDCGVAPWSLRSMAKEGAEIDDNDHTWNASWPTSIPNRRKPRERDRAVVEPKRPKRALVASPGTDLYYK